ncbi:hypothetical protein ACA910_010505 [Epithemia clementina (nom. ined.)]
MADDNTELCPDDHVCRNGSMCVESESRDGRFFCDCDGIRDESTSYAGISCEHAATVYCNAQNAKSYTSFCTNMGTCNQLVGITGEHMGCQCPKPYSGKFCEFLIGQQVPDHIGAEIGVPATASAASKDSSSGVSSAALAVVVVAIVLVVSVTLLLASYFALQTRQKVQQEQQQQQQQLPTTCSKKSNSHPNHHDLALEADGAILKEAMQAMNKNQTMSTTTTTDDDNTIDNVVDEPPRDPTFDIADSESNDDDHDNHDERDDDDDHDDESRNVKGEIL